MNDTKRNLAKTNSISDEVLELAERAQVACLTKIAPCSIGRHDNCEIIILNNNNFNS